MEWVGWERGDNGGWGGWGWERMGWYIREGKGRWYGEVGVNRRAGRDGGRWIREMVENR